MKKWHRNIIVAVLVILILLCILYIANIFMNYDNGRKVYDDIKEVAKGDNKVYSLDGDNLSQVEYMGVNLTLSKNINKDIVSWIYIPDSRIDYPIVKGIDNEKYLNTLVDGSEGMNGTIFIDSRIEDYDRNLVIYGHNMKDGSMFHDLRNYEDAEWRSNHKTVYLSMEDYSPKKYKVIHVSEVRSNDEIYEILLNNDIRAYDWLKKNGSVEEYDNKKSLIGLSTCKGTGDIRILVLIQEL